MEVTEHSLASETVSSGIQTSAVDARALASDPESDRISRWNQIIDRELLEWGRAPGRFEDEDFVSPSPDTIVLAYMAAKAQRDSGAPAPCRVVPTGDGGIVFERWDGQLRQMIEVDAEGRVESLSFVDSILRSRQWL